ncbi:hypothetical protein ISN75_19080 [Dyella marensis]|uniref:hypothetical protein n=1 Tax=Dyella marensis TaxID=500610 RepID=UPI0031E1B06A
MEYRHSKWLSREILGFAALPAGFLIAAFEPSLCSSASAQISLGVVGASLLVLLICGYLYVSRYRIKLAPDGISITGLSRTRSIPFSTIVHVVTIKAPRSGTDSWLLDNDDTIIAKIDGGLLGFDELMASLGERLSPYQVILYRRTYGMWEMQVAGDKKWVPSECPRSVAKAVARQSVILIVGLILLTASALLAHWVSAPH